jgi:hypothetical protein
VAAIGVCGGLGLPLADFATATADRHHRMAEVEEELVRLDEMA